jgi:hypothetical protein
MKTSAHVMNVEENWRHLRNVKKNWRYLEHMHETEIDITKEMIEEGIKQNGASLKYAKKTYVTKKMIYDAFETNSMALQWVPLYMISVKIMEHALKKNIKNAFFIARKKRKFDFNKRTRLFEKNPSMLYDIMFDCEITDERIIYAIDKDPSLAEKWHCKIHNNIAVWDKLVDVNPNCLVENFSFFSKISERFYFMPLSEALTTDVGKILYRLLKTHPEHIRHCDQLSNKYRQIEEIQNIFIQKFGAKHFLEYNGLLLEFIPIDLVDEKLEKLAIENAPSAIEFCRTIDHKLYNMIKNHAVLSI